MRHFMLALTHLLQGLAIAHVTLLIFFLIGAAAFPWCDWESDFGSAPRTMMRVTCTCGLGLAIVGLTLFVLGLAGWLTIGGIGIALALLFAAGCVAWRSSPLRAAFWKSRVRALTRCWGWPLVVVYAALLLVSTRAVIPEATGYSDAIYYHLAYAQDWATAGRLTVDQYLVFTFYANNFVLLFAAWMVLKAGAFVQFLTWSTGLLTALALCAAVGDHAATVSGRGWRVAIALLAVLSVVGTAIFLDYSVLGYIDIPIGAMALLSIVGIQLAIRDRRPGWLVVAAVTAGFLVGMKASYILLVPIFAIALVWGCLALHVRRAAIAGVLLLLCAVAAPWYVRNLILAGDPIPPTVNMALYGKDGLWNASEWNGLWTDMATPRSPRAFVTLPLRAYLNPTSSDFREYGASGMILFLYVPAIVAIVLLFYRRRLSPTLGIPVFVLSAFVLYWFATSSLLRYVLLLYPLLALCVAMLLLEAIARLPRLAPVALALALVAAVPTFTDSGSNKEYTQNDILGDAHALLHYRGETAFLDENDDGYPDEQIAVAWMRHHGYTGNVYVISNNAFDYYFRREGILSIGNWIGPAGYFRLLQALDAGEAAEFLGTLETRAVLFSPQWMFDAGIEHLLARQLEAAGYREVPVSPGSTYHLYVRT